MNRPHETAWRQRRPLEGVTVGISIAYGEDSAARGFSEGEMNRSVVRLSDGLLSAGARLVFGHDWRPNGVMAAVASLAVRYESQTPPDRPPRQSRCIITNLVPWDRRAELPEDLRKDLEDRGILRIEETGLPEQLRLNLARFDIKTLRAAALSFMRQRLAELCDARLCLGGKFEKYDGFWPGIFEEAWSSSIRQQPVFLSGMLGGAARRVLDASRSNDWRTFWTPKPELRSALGELRASHAIAFPDPDHFGTTMTWLNLQTHSGLNESDWRLLADATDVEVVTALVRKGLGRLNPDTLRHETSG